jgi:hypothetical protein
MRLRRSSFAQLRRARQSRRHLRSLLARAVTCAVCSPAPSPPLGHMKQIAQAYAALRKCVTIMTQSVNDGS